MCEPMSWCLEHDCSYVCELSDNTNCEIDLTELSCHTKTSHGGWLHGGARKTTELSKLGGGPCMEMGGAIGIR